MPEARRRDAKNGVPTDVLRGSPASLVQREVARRARGIAQFLIPHLSTTH